MASEKTLKVRIRNRHAPESYWLSNSTFVPRAGEMIVYDPDTTHTDPRVKYGDGTTTIAALPFLADSKADKNNTYTKAEIDSLANSKADKSNTYTKTEIDSLVSAVFRYKGTKATLAEVEALTTKEVGDVWFVSADSSEYAWNGTSWEKLGPVIDLTPYLSNISIAGITVDSTHTSITAAQLKTALGYYSTTEVDEALALKKNKQTAVTDPAASGNAIQFISDLTQNENGEVTVHKKTVSTMTGATAQSAGTSGLVPAAQIADRNKFLKADGTWADVDLASMTQLEIETACPYPS